MSENNHIEDSEYINIFKNVPIVCVDILIQDLSEKFILVKRNNEPLKDEYWVPGGRVFKGEKVIEACSRKSLEELGLEVDPSEWSFVGYYEADFVKNAFEADTHYHVICLTFICNRLMDSSKINLDSQSSDYILVSELPEDFTSQFPFRRF